MKKTIFTFCVISLFFASCEKTKTTTPIPPSSTTNTSTPTPIPGGGDGAIVAVQSISNTLVAGFPISTSIGTALAVFGNLSTATYTETGNITLNTKALSKQSTNAYVYTPSATDITGIDLSGSLDWSISGGAGVGAFTHSATAQGMPVADNINGSFTTINSNNNFTLSTVSSINNSDSVYFQLSGPSGTVLKRLAGNTSSVTFTAAEIQSAGKGTAVVIIAPWNWTVKSLGGKQINVVNELALTRIVTIE